MANANLKNAKKQKNDEFYTQYQDIQKEVNAYLEYDKDVFRGKTILLPCDDPEWSNFTKFFAQNFENFGIKKLISTSFAVESKNMNIDYEPTYLNALTQDLINLRHDVREKFLLFLKTKITTEKSTLTT